MVALIAACSWGANRAATGSGSSNDDDTKKLLDCAVGMAYSSEVVEEGSRVDDAAILDSGVTVATPGSGLEGTSLLRCIIRALADDWECGVQWEKRGRSEMAITTAERMSNGNG